MESFIDWTPRSCSNFVDRGNSRRTSPVNPPRGPFGSWTGVGIGDSGPWVGHPADLRFE
jgi:hypothetical protein